jgi:hypothetical protein
VRQDKLLQTINGANCTFPNSPTKKELVLVCDSYFNTGQIGEINFGWTNTNQFALTYLQIVPVNLITPLSTRLSTKISQLT